MLLNELPQEILQDKAALFGYQFRLLAEDLGQRITDRVSMTMVDMHRSALVHLATRHGFLVSITPAPEFFGAGTSCIYVNCERLSTVFF